MNSRIGCPLICPPNSIVTSNFTPASFSAGPSSARTWRMARPTSWAARNIEVTPCRVSLSPVSGFGRPSCSRLTTDCVTERLPAVISPKVRSPGQEKTCSLRKVEMSSSPALVRVSAIMTSPS